MVMVEGDVGQFRAFLLDDDLLSQGLVFIDVQIEDVDFAIGGASSEDRRRVRCPSNVAHGTAEIVDKEGISARASTEKRESEEKGREAHWKSTSQIFTVQSAEQLMNTFGWKLFQRVA